MEVAQKVKASILEYTNSAPQSDDITMLVFKYNGIAENDTKTFMQPAIPKNYKKFYTWLHKACKQWLLDEALTEHRLLMVASTENVSVSTPTKHSILIRNYWMRWIGNHFVLGCRGKGGYFEHLLWKREVEVLDTNEVQMKESLPELSVVCDDDYDYLLAV
jgi:hypothetical protein